jgi:hypothetical protein
MITKENKTSGLGFVNAFAPKIRINNNEIIKGAEFIESPNKTDQSPASAMRMRQIVKMSIKEHHVLGSEAMSLSTILQDKQPTFRDSKTFKKAEFIEDVFVDSKMRVLQARSNVFS